MKKVTTYISPSNWVPKCISLFWFLSRTAGTRFPGIFIKFSGTTAVESYTKNLIRFNMRLYVISLFFNVSEDFKIILNLIHHRYGYWGFIFHLATVK